MPFIYELKKVQKAKKWTSKQTLRSDILQGLYDDKKGDAYRSALAAFREDIAANGESPATHDFRLTDERIFEITDEGETLDVTIEFMVKQSVITWSFTAPKDETFQDWRDKVFNTAAVAHQNVEHGCDSYYRGSNAYHLKKMHFRAGESALNHNHYRLTEDRPVTPIEVEQHLRAFYNHPDGKLFIPDAAELEQLIYEFKIYWSANDMDPRYATYYPSGSKQERRKLLRSALTESDKPAREQLINDYLARLQIPEDQLPKATSRLANALDRLLSKEQITEEKITELANLLDDLNEQGLPLESIASSEAEKRGFVPAEEYAELLIALSEFASKANFCKDFEEQKGFFPPTDAEVDETSTYESYPSQRGGSVADSGVASLDSKRGSPRELYADSLAMNLDDTIEFKLYAEVLVNRCRDINTALMEKIEPEDFRKALRLYNAMKCLTNGVVSEDAGKRFDPEVYRQVCELQDEINGMVSVEDDPGPAMQHIFQWIQTAPPELEKWIKYIEVNGSRGIGSEIAHTREATGHRNHFFVPMDDRPKDVASVFNLTPKSNSPEDILLFEIETYVRSIMHLTEDDVYKVKAEIGMLLIDVLNGDRPAALALDTILKEKEEWKKPEKQEVKGSLVDLLEKVRVMTQQQSAGPNP